ncbi:hypothetical protein ACVWZ7_000935 [Arthrobacter sp. TE12232]
MPCGSFSGEAGPGPRSMADRRAGRSRAARCCSREGRTEGRTAGRRTAARPAEPHWRKDRRAEFRQAEPHSTERAAALVGRVFVAAVRVVPGGRPRDHARAVAVPGGAIPRDCSLFKPFRQSRHPPPVVQGRVRGPKGSRGTQWTQPSAAAADGTEQGRRTSARTISPDQVPGSGARIRCPDQAHGTASRRAGSPGPGDPEDQVSADPRSSSGWIRNGISSPIARAVSVRSTPSQARILPLIRNRSSASRATTRRSRSAEPVRP